MGKLVRDRILEIIRNDGKKPIIEILSNEDYLRELDKKLNEEHKIVYIPQTYLNRLSDSVEEETEIDKIIHEIVVSNDLDNRSIFDELIPFIKKKKLQRQISVVTHNANVVLGGDAEEIIIANQQGKNSRNDKFRFEYRTGAIEDETYDESSVGILNARGIQQHICDILEGGKVAFDLRKNKYRM